jgi:serine/threonine protein phosphatase PrpC
MPATTPTIGAAGLSDAGQARDVNEDRFFVDESRGIFVVIDGVGGQAAGGKAADTALDIIRAELSRPGGGAAGDRVRAAITRANNEIHRLSSTRPEWRGMACVLTVALLVDGQVVVGHVGDTRLYKLRGGHIVKITPDHSPVGEREDAHEISEIDAMRHPRRHEVYRDVGSDPHAASDSDFVDVRSAPFEPDAALLLCSDGLTDLVTSDTIRQIVVTHAGRPASVVRALVDAANAAGGKDNVTAVFVEGEQHAASAERLRRAPAAMPVAAASVPPARRLRVSPGVRWLAGILAAAGGVFLAWSILGASVRDSVTGVLEPAPSVINVRANESIADAIARAPAGSTVVVEPGEYRERVRLKDNVRVVSRVPRGATLRLPPGGGDTDIAVVAAGVSGAELSGFRIAGDAIAPLGTGVLLRDARARLADLEISGATRAAIDVGAGEETSIVASDLHDNRGAALVIRAGAAPRIAHSAISAAAGSAGVVIEPGANPQFVRNVFTGVPLQAFAPLAPEPRAAIGPANWFPGAAPPASRPASGRGRQQR